MATTSTVRVADSENLTVSEDAASAPKRRRLATKSSHKLVSGAPLEATSSRERQFATRNAFKSPSKLSRVKTERPTQRFSATAQDNSQQVLAGGHEYAKLVRPLTPLLTQEEAFALADARRREERDRRAREARLSVTKESVKHVRRNTRPNRAIKSSVKRSPATPLAGPLGPPEGARMTPHVNRTMTSMRAVAIPYSDTDTSADEGDASTDSNGYDSSKPFVKLKLVEPRPPPEGIRSARKTFGHKARLPNINGASEDSNEESSVRKEPFQRRRSDGNQSNVEEKDEEDPVLIDIDSLNLGHTTVMDVNVNPSVASSIVAAINALPHNRLEAELLAAHRLPFLRRNLRRAMDNLASRLKGPTSGVQALEAVSNMLRVEFLLASWHVRGYQVRGWRCPLCRVLRSLPFFTKAGLELHLSRSHPECEFTFADSEHGIVIRIVLPENLVSEPESSSDEDAFASSSESGREGEAPLAEVDEDVKPFLQRSPTPEQKPFLRGSSVFGSRPLFAPSPFKAQQSSPSLSTIFLPQIGRPGSTSLGLAEPLRPPRPEDPAGKHRYPTPPPYADLEGPACVPPITAASLGLPDDWYSTRPGGARSYDALAADAARVRDKLGMVAWHVSEQEEDIFELDSVLDEDKAVRALWTRFIAMHRRDFIADYLKSTRLFIDENWRIIHRAAGFSALRIWMLMLVHNRFLTGVQFADLLKYYSDLVGMDLWEKHPPTR